MFIQNKTKLSDPNSGQWAKAYLAPPKIVDFGYRLSNALLICGLILGKKNGHIPIEESLNAGFAFISFDQEVKFSLFNWLCVLLRFAFLISKTDYNTTTS